ncbi:MAG: hypothetical protein UW24_C0011G0028 [Parcubacteria group bacterium GW2011_GWA2_44_12]|nr:MAG: hypothetical protein UW24_C0011G0028 [Parcubacteria group bacterium GW2011_GWA2_44_12]
MEFNSKTHKLAKTDIPTHTIPPETFRFVKAGAPTEGISLRRLSNTIKEEIVAIQKNYEHSKPMEPTEERELLLQIAKSPLSEKNEPLRERLMLAHLNFIIKQAIRCKWSIYYLRKYDFPLNDLVQAGLMGLWEASAKFDPRRTEEKTDKPVVFLSYAGSWIKKEMLNTINIAINHMGLPVRHLQAELKLVGRIYNLGFNERLPEMNTLADELSVTQKILYAILHNIEINTPLYLNGQLSREGENEDDKENQVLPYYDSMELHELIQAELNPKAQEQRDYLLKLIKKGISILATRSEPKAQQMAQILTLLYTGETRSIAEAGRRMRISRERANQVYRQAIAALKKIILNIDGDLLC